MSMIVILPFKGESIAGVLNYLSKTQFSTVIKSLEDAEQEFVDEDIHVYLPKFKISSDFVLNDPLNKVIQLVDNIVIVYTNYAICRIICSNIMNFFEYVLHLLQMGIKDIFSRDKADLLGMFYHYLYVTRVIQKAEIEVNEEGTIASAASGTLLLWLLNLLLLVM